MEAMALVGTTPSSLPLLTFPPLTLTPRCSTYRHLSSLRPSPLLLSTSLNHTKARPRRTRPRTFLPHLVAAIDEVEETYIMIKPDGLQRGMVGEIISRFERKGFLLKGLKLVRSTKDLAEEHYKDLKGQSFFPSLIDYITSGPVVCMVWEGVGVVASCRKLIGATHPIPPEPGTIRGDLAVQIGRNVVHGSDRNLIHGSDSPDSGKREIALWFKEGELCPWESALAPWLRE